MEDILTQIPSLIEFVRNIAAGAVLPAVVSFLLEDAAWFQRWSLKAKHWSVFGLFLVLPLAAQALLRYVPAEAWAMLEPYWTALATGFVMWGGSQIFHEWDKRRRQ